MQQPSLKPLPTLDSLDIKCHSVFLRKLNSPRAWRPGDAQASAKDVFPEHTNSLFRVSTNDELYKVAAAINSGRESMDERISFIWIRADELVLCGISLRSVRDTESIRCPAAQRLHVDAAADAALWSSLCARLASGDRSRGITHGDMKRINEFLRPLGCWSYIENLNRQCALCPWATGRLMRLLRRIRLVLFPSAGT